jgi:predicted outer membrane protein
MSTFLIVISGLAIVGLFTYQVIKLLKFYLQEKKDIFILSSLVETIKYDDVNTDHHIVTEELYDKHPGSHVLSIWREFEESLVIKDDHIENTLDADHFFNENSLCPSIFSRDSFKGIPNILVGIGVLFTFIGLVVGLGGLDIASDNIESLKKGIASVVNGAKVSFISSIVGIFFSVTFSSIYLNYKTKLRDKIRELQNDIDFRYPRTNPEKSLAEMREYAKETENHLGALSETLGDRLQSVVREMGSEIRQGIETSLSSTIGPYMEKIADKAMNSSETAFDKIVEEFLSKVSKAGEEQQKLIIETNKTLQSSLVDFRNEFTGQVTGLKEVIENLNKSYHFLENELVNKFSEVVNSLTVAINENERTQSQLETQISKQDVIVSNMQSTSKTLETLNDDIKSLFNKFNYQFEQSIRSFNMTTNNLETIYDANTEATNQMKNAAKNLKEPFDVLQLEYAKMRKEIQKSVENISNKMNDVLNSYFTQVQQQTSERMTEWNNQTTSFSSAMLDVTGELNEIIEKMKKNQKLIK